MSVSKNIRLATLAGLVALACTAAQAETKNMTINAVVAGVCKLTVPTMAFALDPSTGTGGTTSAAITYKCTKGTAPTAFTIAGTNAGSYTSGATVALGALSGPSSAPMKFSLSWTTPTGAGDGFGSSSTDQTVTVDGTIASVDFVDAAAGTYTGSVPVVITP